MISFKPPLNQLREKETECASIGTSYQEICQFLTTIPRRLRADSRYQPPRRTRGISNNGCKYRREGGRMEIEGRISVGTDPLRNFPCQKQRRLARVSSRACFSSDQLSALVVSWNRGNDRLNATSWIKGEKLWVVAGWERKGEGWFVIVEFFKFSLPPSQFVDCTGDYETLCAIEGTIYPVESLQRHYAFRRNETLDKSTELLVERALFKEKWASVISREETKSVFPFVSFRLGD